MIAGLWPFNFWQTNQAGVDIGNGLHLTPPATVYTAFPAKKLLDLKEFTIILNLSSDFSGSNGYARIISFSLDEERSNFMIGQWEDAIVFKLRAFGKPEPIHFETEGVLKKGEKGWVAVIFTGEKLLLYQNGEIKNTKKTGPLSFANWDGTYPLVIGSEANGRWPWEGSIHSIKIFDRSLLPEEIRSLTLARNSENGLERPVIDYAFSDEGSEIKDRGNGKPANLIIPKDFKPYKRIFLEKPSSLKEIWKNIGDIVINLFGFMPVGFLLSAHLNRPNRSVRRVFLLSAIFGFSLSLTIEILQVFLPTRDSSMHDLIANTVGTGVGSVIYFLHLRHALCSKRFVGV